MMKQKGGHGLQARITIDDIPQAQLDLLNSSTVTYEIRDAQTGVLESSETRPMRSFTANFLRLMWGRMTGTACTGGLDINDTAIDESSGKATNLKCVGATTGLKKFGICIGTGTGAVAQTDNKLTWDTGFSTYGATTLKTATTISGSEIYFEIEKAFTNNTGSTRTIYEAGLCTTGEGTEADNNTNVLIAREITNGATGTAVATGKVLTVVFKISSTFTTDGTINKSFMEALQNAFDESYLWRQRSTNTGATHQQAGMLSYKGKLWLIGGNVPRSQSVFSSDDNGDTWTTVTTSAAFGKIAEGGYCVFVDPADGIEKMWIIGGDKDAIGATNQVYNSTDGNTWTQVRANGAAGGFTQGGAFGFCVFDGKMWVICGYNASYANINSVFYSTNGVTWTQARADGAANGPNKSTGSAVWSFAGKMWIAGGNNGSTHYDDVFYSTDGVSWTAATTSAAFGGRSRLYGSCVPYDGKMWLIGGYNGTNTDDIYYSTDGATWTLATNAPGFSARGIYATTVHNGMLFVAGGNDGSAKSDLWSMKFGPFKNATGATMPNAARIDAASGSVYGITAGTGTTNFSGKDGVLIAPIVDGSGASQLDYGDMTDAGRLSEPTVSGADNIMRLERDFANNSGGSITLKEVGLSAKGLDALGLLLMRGKVDKAVADGASVRVAIELLTTV